MVALGRDVTRGSGHLIVFRDGSFIDDEHVLMRAPGPVENSRCFEVDTGAAVPLSRVATKTLAAGERLAISDLIIQGNLIPLIAADQAAGAPR
jgi:hypothetical protein